MTSPLLEVEDLTVRFTTRDGQVTVLDEVSFTLQPGEESALSVNPDAASR